MEFNFKKWKSFIVISIKLSFFQLPACNSFGKFPLGGKSTAAQNLLLIFFALSLFQTELFSWKLMWKTRVKLVIEKHFVALKVTSQDANELHTAISLALDGAHTSDAMLFEGISSIQKHINTHFVRNETSARKLVWVEDLFDDAVSLVKEMRSHREFPHHCWTVSMSINLCMKRTWLFGLRK